jgi:hypothetical protein
MQNRDPPPYLRNMPVHTCSHCGTLQAISPLRAISLNKRRRPIHTTADRSRRRHCRGISCATCNHPACLLCGLDQENLKETCVEHEYRNLAASGDCEGASRLRIARECKACPGCSAKVWKDGGCDAITCKRGPIAHHICNFISKIMHELIVSSFSAGKQVSSASRNGAGVVGQRTEVVGQSAMREDVAWHKRAVWTFMIRVCLWRN